MVAKHHYRPRDPEIARKYSEKFGKLELFTIADLGGWTRAQAEHFDDGGTFDQIFEKK